MTYFLRILVFVASFFLKALKKTWAAGDFIECLLVGYGGANNTGAEARTAEAIRQMLEADSRIRITLTSLNRELSLRYVKETERLRIAQINPVFIFSIPKLVFRSHVVVLIEGSCFKENFSSALLWFFLYAAECASRLGILTIAYGVDAGVLTKSNRRWARAVANKLDLLMVRTEQAKRLLESIGVAREIHVTADTAFTLVPQTRRFAEGVYQAEGIDLAKPIAGIAFEEFFWWPVVPRPLKALVGISEDRYKSLYYHSWRNDGRAKSTEMIAHIARYADWVSEELNAQVVFFAMERLDIKPCLKVFSAMKSAPVLFDSDRFDASQMAALLCRLDWLITCRYHALILSMFGMVPAVGLAHDERIATIMDELGFIDESLIRYDETRILDLLKEKTIIIRKESGRFKRAVERALPLYLRRMEKNRELFLELIYKKFGSD